MRVGTRAASADNRRRRLLCNPYASCWRRAGQKEAGGDQGLNLRRLESYLQPGTSRVAPPLRCSCEAIRYVPESVRSARQTTLSEPVMGGVGLSARTTSAGRFSGKPRTPPAKRVLAALVYAFYSGFWVSQPSPAAGRAHGFVRERQDTGTWARVLRIGCFNTSMREPE
jgi:hypothetical protein